jgi:hypothetical protein
LLASKKKEFIPLTIEIYIDKAHLKKEVMPKAKNEIKSKDEKLKRREK